jgi:hypothetical protein
MEIGSKFITGKGIWVLIFIIIALAIGVYIASGGNAIFPGVHLPKGWSFTLPAAGIIAAIVVVVLTGLIIWWLARSEGGERKGGKKEGGGYRLVRD